MKVNYVFGTLSNSAFFAPSLVPGLIGKYEFLSNIEMPNMENMVAQLIMELNTIKIPKKIFKKT